MLKNIKDKRWENRDTFYIDKQYRQNAINTMKNS